jgi:MYXO-CTERM domain-containing protein
MRPIRCLTHESSIASCAAAAILVLVGCSQDPAPAAGVPDLKTGTVRAALSSSPSPCPTIGSCTLYPDRDTTVYGAVAKDFGKSHELCVGPGNAGPNGVTRALLHFDLSLLPAHFVATSASLSLSARRGAATATLSVYRLLAGSWSEGDGTSIADGHLLNQDCATCAGLGACGWGNNGSFNGASFAVTNNIGAPTATSAVTVPGTLTFTGMAADVRLFASGSNLGWTIRSSDEAAGRPVVFWSTNTAMGDAGKPALTVSYGRGPGSSGCTTNSDCFFANGTTGFCAPNGVCCSAACNDDGNSCTAEACDATGACTHPNRSGTCDDGNACTTGETCQSGTCTGGSGVVCAPLDQCHVAGVCAGGVCSNPVKANGTACNDGNACTTGETCQSGACAGGTSVICAPLDQCHNAGVCAGGVCSNPVKPNGIACTDGNPCTTGETCQSGTCTGGTGVVCSPPDQCHVAGTCSGGVCTNPVKPNGTPCNDGNACTTGETCQSGACAGGSGTVCPPADQCHTQAVCSGGACPANPNKPNGTPCDDGSTCTSVDTCQNGVCTGGSGTACPPPDQCHSQGTCSNGTCSNPPKPNGTPCDDGDGCTAGDTCQKGVCTPGTPTSGPDECRGPTTCSNNVCSYTIKPNGSPCKDHDACTSGETCQSGSCTPGTKTICPAVDQCHSKGKCNPSDGTCSSPPKANGTACDDGDPCTAKDICENGICGGLIVAGCVPPMPGPSTALRVHEQPAMLNAGAAPDAASAAQGSDGIGTTHQLLGVISSTTRAALSTGMSTEPASVDGGAAKRADAALDDQRAAAKPTSDREPDGCSCRAPASRKTEPRGVLVIAALALLAARRRRWTST